MGSWYYIVDGEFAAYALKIYITLERIDEELRLIVRCVAMETVLSSTRRTKIHSFLVSLTPYQFWASRST